MDWDNIYTCPICGDTNCVPPHNTQSPILIVAEFPGKEEIISGIPLVGRTGTVLKQMLSKMGYALQDFALCNLWQHKPDKDKDNCKQHGKKIVIETAKDKKLILLIGSDVADVFLTKNISEVTGLEVTPFLITPIFNCPVYAMMNPAIVFQKHREAYGEINLALQKFVKEVEKI